MVTYAVAFALISILIEVVLLAAGFEIRGDGALFAGAVLLAGPPLAARVAGLAKPGALAWLWPTTAVLTVAGSAAFGTVTGLLAPLIIRPIAGYAAAWFVATRQPTAQELFERR